MLQLNAELLELLEANPQQFEDFFVKNHLCLNLADLSEQRENKERLQLLVQQLIMGLPVEPLLQNYPKFANWVNQLKPLINAPSSRKQLNVVYQKLLQNVLIFTRFDLLMAGYENLTAVNWSITDKVITSDNLQKSWRTQMGLFLLAQNEQVLLENISMVYCFFNVDGLSTTYKFSYSQSQHDSFKKRLQCTLSRLPIYYDADEQVIPVNINQAQLNLQKFASGELSTLAYLENIPEVEI